MYVASTRFDWAMCGVVLPLTPLCTFQKALLSDSHSNARDGEVMAFLEKYDVKLLHLLGSEKFNVYDYIHAVKVHHKVGEPDQRTAVVLCA